MERSDPRAVSTTAPHRATTGKFRNPLPSASPHGFRDVLKWVAERRGRRRAESHDPTRAAVPSFTSPRAERDEIAVTWIGHSSFLLQIGSVNILLDPVWSRRASPVSFLGPARISAPGVAFDSLPPIDLVLLSHDHYDHLDRATVGRVVREHPGAEWIAPMGVGAWLRRRGAKVLAELDWWQDVNVLGLHVTCTPAQHFSGRRPDNRDSTLWCGWVISADDRAVFFAGDTGSHPEFPEITARLGPFDAAFLPIGAYDPRWFMGPVHMAPDESVSAYAAIAASNGERPCTFIAMHWGTFRLTDEPMDEPPRLTRDEWSRLGLEPALLWIPARGETRRV